jgi:hypothetical protein
MLETATMNWGYFQRLPDDAEVMRLLEEGEHAARASDDDVSLARLLMERAAFTGDVSGTEEIARFVEGSDAVRFGDAAYRMATVYMWNGQIDRAMELFRVVFERLIPEGAVVNLHEAPIWYGLAAFQAGALEQAEAVADRGHADAERQSAHTRQHYLSLRSLVCFGRGDWDRVTATAGELAQLVEANPDASFCLLGGAAVGYGAVADVLAGRPLPARLDESVARMVSLSELVQASSVMLPKVMAGDVQGFERGRAAYAPDIRLRDRQAAWDVIHLVPAIALTMLERWEELGAVLHRLDDFASSGGRLAGATAAAIREEQAAAAGGPSPEHAGLHALGFAGISELLRYRVPAG